MHTSEIYLTESLEKHRMIIFSDDLRRIIHPRSDFFISRETPRLALNRDPCALGHSRRTTKRPKFGSLFKKTNTTLDFIPHPSTGSQAAWNRLDRLTVMVNDDCDSWLSCYETTSKDFFPLVFLFQIRKSSTKNMRSKKHFTFQNIQKYELEMSEIVFPS